MVLVLQAILVGVFIGVVVAGCIAYIISRHCRSQAAVADVYFAYPSRAQPVVATIYRGGCSIFYIVILLLELVENGFSIYKYYTIWNFTLQLIYFVWATTFSLRLAMLPAKAPIHVTPELRTLNTLFGWVLPVSFVVLIVFWALLYGPGYDLSAYSVAEHAVNNILLVLEFAANDFYVGKASIVYACLLWPALYAAWACLSYATWLGSWPYKFLDLDKNSAIGWYIGVLLGHFILFGVAYLLSVLKRKLKPSLVTTPPILAEPLPVSSTDLDSIQIAP
ncbi:hypothetical protein SPRG_16959 [Saprolegnia parasitica CBS 223.65]|uniref:Uncharacterized protein n=1 Tax=Saprolegnia parasitica (strain CBS 223.65) TaxID=695850 RepID=A0A067BHJ2_SAPPC|nr:hypothetical protein SPRG_16959 [Saprolegnia parasitica CBS 223.65]KDO17648.1 hypothetical protein SPRG_16959 [Saprolegnia parasitica CBS 223.65]|eukprot:XP_012211641.1 hypothetical protein SPRG_16959 [Saprolegnia parasitica CBS 223.65]